MHVGQNVLGYSNSPSSKRSFSVFFIYPWDKLLSLRFLLLILILVTFFKGFVFYAKFYFLFYFILL